MILIKSQVKYGKNYQEKKGKNMKRNHMKIKYDILENYMKKVI